MTLIQIVKVKCSKCNKIFEREHEPICGSKCPYCELDCGSGGYHVKSYLPRDVNHDPGYMFQCVKCGKEDFDQYFDDDAKVESFENKQAFEKYGMPKALLNR